jgi:CBS domain-containing membrane protein
MATLLVKDIMSTNVVTLEEEETLDLAEKAMKFGRLRHLPVVKNGELVGLVTQRDLLRIQVSSLAEVTDREQQDILSRIRARDVMQREVFTVEPGTPLVEAAHVIKENKIGCLPVLEDGKLVGIVTESDFIDLVIRMLERGGD